MECFYILNIKSKICVAKQIDYKSILHNSFYSDKIPKKLINKFLIMHFKNRYLNCFHLFFFISEEYLIYFNNFNHQYKIIDYYAFMDQHLNINSFGYKYIVL